MTATRRKRDDDSSHMNSQCSDSFALDISSTSQAYSRAQKRRRTLIDALQQVSVNDVPDQILGDEVLDDNSQLSSEDDLDDGSPIIPKGSASAKNNIETHLMSDVQEAERAVMFDLVFAPPPSANPVDRKLEAMIRESLQQAAQGRPPTMTQDDMDIETSYAQPCSNKPICEPKRQRSNSMPMNYGESASMDVS